MESYLQILRLRIVEQEKRLPSLSGEEFAEVSRSLYRDISHYVNLDPTLRNFVVQRDPNSVISNF